MKTLVDIFGEVCFRVPIKPDFEAGVQAVRAAVIEECAKLCDKKADDHAPSAFGGELANLCAKAIRRLK